MSFYGQFMSHFTREEQNTEVVKAWAAIGVDTEKSLIEQISAQTTSLSDINGFYPDLYRSWLAFFLRRVSHAYAPRVMVTVTNPESSSYPVDIKSSYDDTNPSQLVSNGTKYVQTHDLTLVPGSSVQFEAIQGTVVKASGTYSEIITISTNKVDLSTLQVTINGTEIQPVSLMSSWTALKFMGSWVPDFNNKFPDPDNPSPYDDIYRTAVHIYDGVDYDHKGDFYMVTNDGTAEIVNIQDNTVRQEKFYRGQYVVYNGKTWGVSMNEPSFLPKQMDASYVIPFDGYYAYYQEGNLYIKVFPGPTTADPEGGTYSVVFIDTDGAQGVVTENTLSYSAPVHDTNGDIVEVVVKNANSTTGYSTTEVGELNCLLRDRLFSTINVSSIPEYTAFFNAQPEVGDCRVVSDFENYLATGEQSDTGWVSVYLLDATGEAITDEQVVTQLLQRIRYYMDVAAIQVVPPSRVENVIHLKYASSADDTAFVTYATSIVNSFYNMSFLKQHGLSLFEDLDLFQLLQYAGGMYNVIGLIAEAYHFASYQTNGSTPEQITIYSYSGEDIGSGFYRYYEQTGIDPETGDPVYASNYVEFYERLDNLSSTVASICEANGHQIGNHAEGEVTIYNNASGYQFSLGKIECFWPMKDQGVLTVGKSDGYRKLTKLCQTGAVRVERYK